MAEVSELYRKWRPRDFDAVIGQVVTVKSLEKMLKSKGGFPHAILLAGPSGCGKTTLARIIKEHLKCGKRDFTALDGATYRGIDDIKRLKSSLGRSPNSDSACRIWLIDECHQLTKEAQSAMLASTEDTPSHVYFIFCTSEIQKVIPAIRTRMTTFTVKSLNRKDLIQVITDVLGYEERKLASTDVMDKIVDAAEGSARTALVILKRVLEFDTEDEQLNAIVDSQLSSVAFKLAQELMNPRCQWADVAKLIKTIEEEPETCRRIILGYANTTLLSGGKMMPRARAMIHAFRDNFYDTGKVGLTLACDQVCNPG